MYMNTACAPDISLSPPSESSNARGLGTLLIYDEDPVTVALALAPGGSVDAWRG